MCRMNPPFGRSGTLPPGVNAASRPYGRLVNDKRDRRPTAHSRMTLGRIMTAIGVNLYGTVYGGVLMKLVDDVAGASAARHSGGTAPRLSTRSRLSTGRGHAAC